jgi:hypothetical protein
VAPDPDEELHRYAGELADAIERELPGWVIRSVERRLPPEEDGAAMDQAGAAGQRARLETGAQIRELLEQDIDEQRTTPLALLRAAVVYPTGVLRDAGVPPVGRDEFALDAFPDDDYDLAPAAFADVHPSLHEPAIAWGAAKAYVHLHRHGGEGR